MDLLKDNLKKLYLRFWIPSLGSTMVMSIYTLTDAIVIGKGVGSDALAALSITTPLLCILMAMGIWLGVMLGGVVNIVLDIVFVFPFQMGIGGAALASAIGMVIQVMVGTTHFFSRKNQLKFIRPKHVISSVGQIIGNGIPSFFNEFANGFIVLLFNIQILRYCGEAALSVYSVISNCVILFNSLFTGVGQSIQPIIATNYGAGKWERIKKVRNMAFFTIAILGAVFSLSGILFPEGVCSVFMNLEDEMRVIAKSGLRMYFVAFLPMGMNLLTSYYLQSVLCVKRSLCISLLRNVILSSLAILMFPLVFGGDSLWLVMPVVEVVVLVLSVVFLAQLRTE